MPTIAFASSKGGAGKTTSAIVLGTELAANGARVVMIDADPARRLIDWSTRAPMPDRIEIVISRGEEAIQDEIEEARRRAAFVLIDLEGSASQRTSFSIAESDLVIVPTADEHQDAKAALDTLREVARVGRAMRRDVPAAILFVRTNAAVKSRLEKYINAETRKTAPSFKTELHKRTAFSSLHNAGAGLRELDPMDVNGIDKAIENASEWASEVVEMLKEARYAQAS